MLKVRFSWLSLALACVMPACVGSIDGAGGSGSRGNQPNQPGAPSDPGTMPANPGTPSTPGLPILPGEPGQPGQPAADPDAAGPQPLRRLDQREYNNTVRDLLGDTTRPGDGFPSDRDSEFPFRHPGLVSSQDYSTIQDAAESLAGAAEKNVATLAPCAGNGDEACARDFATKFGLRAYRRPLVEREIESLVQLYKDARAAAPTVTHANAIRVMLEGMLQSPAFLYHWESGPAAPTVEGKVVKLGHYENASRLSYFIWGSMPDNTLFDAAAAGKLGTQQELEDQARRLLADPKARETVSDFVEQWLNLDKVTDRPKDPKVYPEWTEPLKAAMVAEARTFVSNVVFTGDGKLGTLLTAPYSFVNQPLAAIYGAQAQGMDLKQVNLEASQRAGLLTQAAFLTLTGSTDGSDPVKRGKKVFERLLCGVLPPPPAEVPPPKPPSAGGTTRQRFAEHSAQACAAGCHANMDPLGYPFENYDGLGRYRTMDNGEKVDASSSFEIDGQQKTFKDAVELANILANSKTVRACFAVQWARYALRRNEVDADRASLAAIAGAFGKDGYNVRDLLIGVVGSRSFRYRAQAEGETLK